MEGGQGQDSVELCVGQVSRGKSQDSNLVISPLVVSFIHHWTDTTLWGLGQGWQCGQSRGGEGRAHWQMQSESVMAKGGIEAITQSSFGDQK